MALTAEQDQFIADVGGIAHALLDLEGDMMIVNTLWNGAPDWDTLITDANIAEMPALVGVGLTKTELADAIFTIEAIRQVILTGNLAALVLLSRLK